MSLHDLINKYSAQSYTDEIVALANGARRLITIVELLEAFLDARVPDDKDRARAQLRRALKIYHEAEDGK